jgi:hypothetical protein
VAALVTRFDGFVLATFAALVVCAASCSPRRALNSVSAGDSVAVMATPWDEEDSLLVVEDALAGSETPVEDIAELPTPAAETNTRTSGNRGRPGPKPRRITADVTTIVGTRREVKGTVGSTNTLSVGFRSNGMSTLAYLRLGPWWVVRSAVVGNMTLRMGERLVLGRGFTSYPLLTTGGVREGIRAAPSLSRWSGRSGVAVTVGADSWDAHAILLGTSQAFPRLHPTMLWVSARSRFRVEQIGLSIGRRIARTVNDATPHPKTTVMSLHASHRTRGLEGSGEYVRWFPGESYFALRLLRRGALRWSIRYYRAPLFPSSANPAIEPTPSGMVLQGVTVDTSRPYGSTKARLVISLGSRRSAIEKQRFTRTVLSVSGKSRGFDWEGSLLTLEEIETHFPTDVIVHTSSVNTAHKIRLRARAGIASGGLSHTVTLDYRPGRRWNSEGFSLTVGTGVNVGRLEARWQATAYSLASGQSRLITRPGVGTFEWISTVYGTGSDVSVRVRLRLWHDLFLLGFYGLPWLKEGRAYVGTQFVMP